MARKRRLRELWAHRDEERERQSRCRERRAEETRHVPRSACNVAELREKLREVWDSASAASRASFERSMPGILRGMQRSGETRAGPQGRMSRAE